MGYLFEKELTECSLRDEKTAIKKRCVDLCVNFLCVNNRGVDSTSSQRPWLEKRKRRAPKTNTESSPFERELLTLLSKRTPDLAADDLAFFASLGQIHFKKF